MPIALLFLSCAAGPPASFLSMEANRRAFVGTVEWTVIQADGREVNFISRFAENGDYIFENRGTAVGGWTEFGPRGEPTSRMPRLYMGTKEGFWEYHETNFVAQLYEPQYAAIRNTPLAIDRDVRDYRGLGVFPSTGELQGGDALGALSKLGNAQWTERRLGSLVEVCAQVSDAETMLWELDPSRGWNPLRARLSQGGVVIYEALSELKQFDEVWLPDSVQFIAGGEPICRVFLRAASVSRGNGPVSFSPTDIRIEPGVNIWLQSGTDLRNLTWTGSRLMPLDMYHDMVQKGELPKPTIFDRYMRNHRYAGPYLMPAEAARLDLEYTRTLQDRDIRRHEQLWERFVRDFIKRFQLNDEQSAAAWRVHMACIGQAREYVERNNKRLVDALGKLNEARDANDADKSARAKEAWDKLQQPIQRIFEEQLKPRLEKLPTRAQRAAAEAKAPSSQPADTKKP